MIPHTIPHIGDPTQHHKDAHRDGTQPLGSATGVPGKFDIVYFIHAVNCGQAESYVHQRLADYRTTGGFFDVPISIPVDGMDEVANQFTIIDGSCSTEDTGWLGGDDWLPQAFRHGIGPYPHCGKKNKIHMLAVPSIPKGGKCRRNLSD